MMSIYDVGGGPKLFETSTDLKFFEGTLNMTTRDLTISGRVPSNWMFETSRVPYDSVDAKVLTVNVIFPMMSSEGRMFRDKWSGKLDEE